MAPLRVLVRVDATPAIGLGHAMRCLALVQELREAGHSVWVATCELPEGLLRQFETCGAVVEQMPLSSDVSGNDADAQDMVGRAHAHAVHWAIADGYAFGATWQQQVTQGVRANGTLLALFDDEATAPAWHADLLINQNLGATPGAYAGRAGGAEVLAGAHYVLLREQFRHPTREPRATPEVAQRVLVTMGGADPDNITERIVQSFGLTGGHDPVEVRVLVGAANPHGASIVAAARLLPAHVTMHVLTQVNDMPQQMQWADIAVSAGGSTLWELAYMHLPAVALILADNQRGGVNACHAVGSVQSLGDAQALTVENIAHAITALRQDANRRAAMSRAGSTLVDGHGARRIMQRLCAMSQHTVECGTP